MKSFHLELLAADHPLYIGPCESLTVSTLDGKYGILANHSNMILTVVPGPLFFRPPGQDRQILSASYGLVKVENNTVLVLVDSLERPEDIDANRARRAAEAAREQILQSKSRQEYHAAQAHLARALNRLKIKGTYASSARKDK